LMIAAISVVNHSNANEDDSWKDSWFNCDDPYQASMDYYFFMKRIDDDQEEYEREVNGHERTSPQINMNDSTDEIDYSDLYSDDECQKEIVRVKVDVIEDDVSFNKDDICVPPSEEHEPIIEARETHPHVTIAGLIGGVRGRGRRMRGRGRRNEGRRRRPVNESSRVINPFRPIVSPIPGRTGVPPRLRVKLVSTGQITLKSSTNPYAVADERINSAYGPDPSNSAVQGTGFNMYSAGYAFNVVRRAWIEYSVSNLDTAQPVSIGMVFSDVQPSSVITSFAAAEAALQRPPCIPKESVGVLSGNGVIRKRSPILCTPSKILGNPQSYYGNSEYSGSATAGPTAVIWGGWVLMSDIPTGTLPSGVLINYTLVQEVEFYSTLTVVAYEASLREEEQRILRARRKEETCPSVLSLEEMEIYLDKIKGS